MEEGKYCPLLTMASSSLPQPEGLKYCLKQDCAWWTFATVEGCNCAIALFPTVLGYMNQHMAYMK